MKEDCDHIIAFHIGHGEVKGSKVDDYIKNEGKPESWCCGGCWECGYCPTCGKKIGKHPKLN